MILPDVNILLYATDRNSKFHTRAAEWLAEALSTEQVFFSWQTISGFLRLSTNPAASVEPLTIAKACMVVDEWLALDNTHLVSLEKKNWPVFRSMLIEGQVTGNLVMDAHVAAMAASCGSKVATTDRDFSRFVNLQIIDPFKDR